MFDIYYLPEFIILITAFLQILCLFFKHNISRVFPNIITIFGMSLSIICLIFIAIDTSSLIYNTFKIMIYISAILIYFLSSRKIYIKKNIYFNIFYLLTLYFLNLMIDSDNYLSLYINIELFSVAMYFLMTIDKSKKSFSETIKYQLSSALATSFLLIGSAILYGLTNKIDFQHITDYINQNNNYSISTFILPYVFIITGILFKLGAFPFGRWLIDIYTNIDTKIVAYISIVPKLAIFAVLMKMIGSMITFESSLILIIFALYTALFGIIYGFKINRLKSIMAASSYVNISYVLIGVAAYTHISISAVIFYLISYIFMNIGVFAGILCLEHSNLTNNTQNYQGYFYKNPFFALSILFCFISLVGLPISAGFVAKIYLVLSILYSNNIFIPVIIAMFAIMIFSIVFYIRPIENMFLKLPYSKNCEIKTRGVNKYILYICSSITIIMGLFPQYLLEFCETISKYF